MGISEPRVDPTPAAPGGSVELDAKGVMLHLPKGKPAVKAETAEENFA